MHKTELEYDDIHKPNQNNITSEKIIASNNCKSSTLLIN